MIPGIIGVTMGFINGKGFHLKNLDKILLTAPTIIKGVYPFFEAQERVNKKFQYPESVRLYLIKEEGLDEKIINDLDTRQLKDLYYSIVTPTIFKNCFKSGGKTALETGIGYGAGYLLAQLF